jgi:metallo-beta-lactamase class B
MIHRFPYIRSITVLFLGCVLSVIDSDICAQSGNESIKLSDDVEVRQLAEGVWLHVSYYDIDGFENVPANGIIVIDTNEAIMIDLPWTDEQTGVLFNWVTKKQNATIKKVVPTHWHIDCSGGLAEAHRRKAESFALDKTVELLKTNNKPAPVNWFTDRLSLSCGKIRMELAYFGPGHTVDNIAAWIPAKKILFAGDLVRARNARNLGNTAEADVEIWPKTLKKVRDAFPDAKIVVPGHGQPGGMELIDHTINLCENMR